MKKPDYGLSLEYGILGGLLSWPKYIGEAAAILAPEDFSDGLNRSIYTAILKLFLIGAPIDNLTVLRELGEGYGEALEALMPLGTPQVEYYGRLLKEHNKLKRVQALGLQLAGAATVEEAQPLIDEITGMECVVRDSEPSTLVELVAEYVRQKASKAPPPEYLSFGIEELDRMVFAEAGDFLVIGGKSSSGKTMLSLQMALHMSHKLRVGYFSLETDKRKVNHRLISNYTGIDLRSIKLGRESAGDMQKIMDMGSELAEREGSLSIHRLRGARVRDIKALALRYRYDVIFIDYLQLLRGEGKSRYEQITNISLELRNLSPGEGQGITVVALSQLSRPETFRGKERPPDMSDLKESGQIENDADVVMLLYRADEKDKYSPRWLKVAKNKEGELGEVLLDFDGAHQRMVPMTPAQTAAFLKLSAEYEMKKKQEEREKAAPEQVSFEDLRGEDSDLPFPA